MRIPFFHSSRCGPLQRKREIMLSGSPSWWKRLHPAGAPGGTPGRKWAENLARRDAAAGGGEGSSLGAGGLFKSDRPDQSGPGICGAAQLRQ
jgi:hypothetical protein